ncbi:MAG: type II toxin-antitoxin system RelE/ParE family toxin [Rubrobacter sp.]|nr:type II toxin-antitoxin system RelE/ParE family toxin [Rubrobacter sp.]
MGYEVIVERKARKAIARLPQAVYDRVMRAIDNLAEDPRPRQSRQLQGSPARRLRVGDYRIVYDIDDANLKVFIAEVWHRQRGCR